MMTTKWSRFGIFLALAAFAAVVLATPAEAKPKHSAQTYVDQVSGFETYATSTEGRFSGAATGDLPGVWSSVVVHDQLSGANPAAITGGSFTLATWLNGSPSTIRGSLASGSVVQVSGFSGCENQEFAVSGVLSSVGPDGGPRKGTGSISVLLTHYRVSIFGACVTYSASVAGTVSMTF